MYQTKEKKQERKITPEELEKIKAEIEAKRIGFLKELLGKYLSDEDIKAVDAYIKAVLNKFERYIKAIVFWGSAKTGVAKRKTSDIDIAIIVDDTDVRRMTRAEVKEKLFQRLVELADPISKKIHPQPYLLTEWWQYVRDGTPVIYNILKDGIVLYDTGFFLPIQMLMKMGHIRPSKEAIDKHISIADDLLKLAKHTILHKITYDYEQAVVSSAQAVLMELGYRPPAPNEIADFVEKFLVEKHGLVDKEYAEIARKVVKTYKDIEHKEKKDISGEELEELERDTKKFVEKMKEILKKIREEKGEDFMYEIYSKEEKEQRKVKRDGVIENA